MPPTLVLVVLFVNWCTMISAKKPPNILFIMADDLGYNDLDWRDQTLHTPHLRKLAFHQNSVQLTNSYVNQLCTPTRSAFMTGYYPFRVGTQNGVFLHMEPSGVPLMFPFLPENLRSLGYSTYLIGKWHLGYCRREFLPTSRGFDYFYGFYGPQAGYFNHSTDQWHNGLKRVVRGVDLFEELGDGYSTPVFDQNGVYSTDLFADAAMELIEIHDKSKPFFLFLSFQAVHPPLQVPKRFDTYCSRVISKSRRIYCGMLTAMDFAIGRVIELLKTTGDYENTVIIFTSDNGGTTHFGASNYPLRGEKDTLWEGGTKTTTIVHAPRFIRMNGIRPELFHVVDWHATLLALAGLQIDSYGDGINQWDYIVTGLPRLRRFRFVYNIDDHGSAIRDGQFKLIHGNADRRTRSDRGKNRLYRLTEDPGEKNDISKRHPRLVRRLRLILLQLQKYMRKNVRKPVTLRGNPEIHNGSYASYWCT
ncbi:Sulfatase [Parelaphostrongylus tenuis]|uniref:Sulfatase n=1 Tax=Parelaphostrongylus tenuis TaxID=148309 RepID=A0AAD5N5J0_PARTN|nr:Sulfatase [Parelaphostrongylus tenuis]